MTEKKTTRKIKPTKRNIMPTQKKISNSQLWVLQYGKKKFDLLGGR